MTARKPSTARNPKPRADVALAKRTLKDLSAGRNDPKGGFLMKDSVIVRPTR
jgi:hypothetical protein